MALKCPLCDEYRSDGASLLKHLRIEHGLSWDEAYDYVVDALDELRDAKDGIFYGSKEDFNHTELLKHQQDFKNA